MAESFATCQWSLTHFQASDFETRISDFHYAGHAGAERLLLTEADGKSPAVHSVGFAKLIGQQDGFQFVFLNGCGTKPQVQALFEGLVGRNLSDQEWKSYFSDEDY